MDDTNDMDKDLGPVARIKPIQVFRFLENGNIGVYVEIANKRTDIIGGKNRAKFWVICGIIKTVNNMCGCLLYTSPSPRDRQKSRMPSSA